MNYVTYISKGPSSITPNVSFEDVMKMLYGPKQNESHAVAEYSEGYMTTHTILKDTYISGDILGRMNDALDDLLNMYAEIPEECKGYEQFFIPKHSGGIRTISAPSQELKAYLRGVTHFFQNICRMQTHNDSFAYIKGRCAKDAMVRHQLNNSRWFLKLDLKDFFPASNTTFIVDQMMKLFPLCHLERYRLLQLIETCMLDGGLPQGSPASPIITNLIMIPFDHELSKTVWDFNKSHFVYTRYADDLLISNQYGFDRQDIIAKIEQLLKDTPYQIKHEKTRYGSNAGRNWNLGMMLTQDNRITVGTKRKERIKAAIHNLICDWNNHILWPVRDVQVLLGNMAYIDNIEPGYQHTMIEKINTKYNVSFKSITIELLKQIAIPD